MHVLAIDIGSYSVKYVSSFVEKRRTRLVEMSEIIITDFMEDRPGLSPLEAQAMIVAELIDSIARADTRIIFQADNEIMTTRFLTLPVKSKKKAELMLPFQLEEDIPFSLGEIHYAHRIEAAKTQHMALVGLIKESTFEAYFNTFKDKNALPSIITTEASLVENYFNQNALAGTFCVLDLGHKTTKAYFFYNSRLIVSHISYLGGADINQMIAENYKIDPDEAIIYKHQNAFVLTSNQFEDVDDSQRDFAHAMDKTLAPLIADFSRWKIGLKVNYGLTLQHIFITGGTSNIIHLSNYLTEKWDTKVVLLETFDQVEAEKVDVNSKNKSKFALVNMMAQGMKRKNRFINLLSGKFAQASFSEIPLHSFAFISTRIAIVSFVIFISLITERFFIEKDIKQVNLKLSQVLKNDSLGVNPRLRRAIATNPRPVLESLEKNLTGIRQEISTIQSALKIKSLSPLLTISQSAASTTSTLINYKTTEAGDVMASFSAESVEELIQLKALLEKSELSNLVMQINESKLLLTLTAKVN